jgi:hypothetical protein
MTRVLLNLISNSFYATRQRKAEANGGSYEPILTAATKNLGDSVEIRIRDNGTGMSPEVTEKDLQSVLHDQTRWRRHWPWLVHQSRHHRHNIRGPLRSTRSPANSPISGSSCRVTSKLKAQLDRSDRGRRDCFSPPLDVCNWHKADMSHI